MRINDGNGPRIVPGIRTVTTTGDPGQQSARQPALIPDQQVKGEVFARLSDQVYLVRIAGDIYRTELPLPLRPGDPLLLTFRANEPRPSFTMQNNTFDAAPVKLSPTASWLNTMVTDALNSRPEPLKCALGPLINAPPTDLATLARWLRNSLTLSGLFYESHLLQWFLGERLLADILKEPQARLSVRRERGKEVRALDISQEENGVPTEENPGLNPACGKTEAPGLMEELFDLASPPTIPVIREQVALLLSGMLRWQGEVWPGQDMEWDVEKGADGPEQEAEQSWHTNIRLQLPNLGSVSATLTFASGGIRAALKADSTATTELMEKELGALGRNMADSGLRLLEMVIECEDEG